MPVWPLLIGGGVLASWWSLKTGCVVILAVSLVRFHIWLDLPHLYIAMSVIWATAALIAITYNKSVAACFAIVGLVQIAHLLGLNSTFTKYLLAEGAVVLALIIGAANGSTGTRDLFEWPEASIYPIFHRFSHSGNSNHLHRGVVVSNGHSQAYQNAIQKET